MLVTISNFIEMVGIAMEPKSTSHQHTCMYSYKNVKKKAGFEALNTCIYWGHVDSGIP